MLRRCYVRATYVLRKCYVSATYVLRTCYVRATYVLRTCYVRATYVLRRSPYYISLQPGSCHWNAVFRGGTLQTYRDVNGVEACEEKCREEEGCRAYTVMTSMRFKGSELIRELHKSVV